MIFIMFALPYFGSRLKYTWNSVDTGWRENLHFIFYKSLCKHKIIVGLAESLHFKLDYCLKTYYDG